LVVGFDSIQDFSFRAVRFISAKLGKDSLSEFEKFDRKEFPKLQHMRELQIIYKTIEKIGERGAKSFFFRHEGPAFALPGKVDQELIDSNPDDFGIRLYCGLLRPDLVLLLNGGIKTKLNPEDCPNVGPHFRNAVKLVRALLKAENNGFVRFTGSGIEMDEGFEIEI